MSLEIIPENFMQKKDAADEGMATLIDELLISQDAEMEAEDSSLSAEEEAQPADGEGKRRRRRRGRRNAKKDKDTQQPQKEQQQKKAGSAATEVLSSNSTGSLSGSMCSSQPQLPVHHTNTITPQVAALPAQYLTSSNDGKRAVPSTRNLEDMEGGLTVEDMQQRNVYISGLPPLFTNKDLRELVSPFGVVKTLKCCVDHEHNDRVLLQRSAAAAAAAGLPMFTHPLTGQLVPVASVDLSTYNSAVTFTKGYGFILFYTKESAAACIQGLNDLELQDCCLKARYSETRATPFGRSSGDEKNRYISCHVDKVKERQAKERENHERKLQQQQQQAMAAAAPQQAFPLPPAPAAATTPFVPPMSMLLPQQQQQQLYFPGAMPPMGPAQQPMLMMPQMPMPMPMQPMYYPTAAAPMAGTYMYPAMQPMPTTFYC